MAKYFCAEAVNTTCYIQNKISIRPILEKTPYELWRNRKPNISYFHPFGCVCYILNTMDNLNKFDFKAQKCFMLGYSELSKGYIVYNVETQIVEESINVRFDDKLGNQKPKHAETSADLEVDLPNSEAFESKNIPEAKNHSEATAEANPEITPLVVYLDNLRISEEPTLQKRSSRITSSHPEETIIGKKDDPIRIRSLLKNSETSLF